LGFIVLKNLNYFLYNKNRMFIKSYYEYEDKDTFMKTIQVKTLFIAFLLSIVAPSLLAKMNLFKAASQGDLDAVEKFIAADVDVNERFYKHRAEYFYSEEEDTERWGRTALMEAAKNGHLSVVKLLLANNADPNLRPSKGLTALMEAVEGGRVGRLKVIEELIKSGADINRVGGKDGETALMMAVDLGRLKAAKLLLTNNADPNIGWSWAEEYKPLILAAMHNNLKMAQLLLANRAEVDGVDFTGETALMYAVRENNVAMVKLLLANEADINASTELGGTALMHAVWGDNVAMVELLLGNGAEIDALNFRDDTALMAAARDGRLEIVELLLTKGSDFAIRNKEGKTALKIAEEHANTAVAKLIRSFVIEKQKKMAAALVEVEEELPVDLAKLISEFETGLEE